jgi:hypothetical protein
LDFFINSDTKYSEYIELLTDKFIQYQNIYSYKIDYQHILKTSSYTKIFLTSNQTNVKLKIELINDVASHFSGFQIDKILGKIDSWQNILSNKLTAIFRYEPKDIVDIWAISKRFPFSWIEIIEEAKTKEAGIDPIVIKEILCSFPVNILESIKWVREIDKYLFIQELTKISDDVFEGKNNSLVYTESL